MTLTVALTTGQHYRAACDNYDDDDDVPTVTRRCGAECCRLPRSIRRRARTAGCSAKGSTFTSSSPTRSSHPSRSPGSIYSDGVSRVVAEEFFIGLIIDIAFPAVRTKKNTFSSDNIRFSPEHCKHCISVTGDGMFAVAAVVEHTSSFVRPMTHTPGTGSRNRRHKFDARIRRRF